MICPFPISLWEDGERRQARLAAMYLSGLARDEATAWARHFAEKPAREARLREIESNDLYQAAHAAKSELRDRKAIDLVKRAKEAAAALGAPPNVGRPHHVGAKVSGEASSPQTH